MVARAVLIGVSCALVMASTVFAAEALSKHDAQDIARDAAREECLRTSGCQTYRAFDVKKVSRLKAVGKIEVQSSTLVCKRKLTMTLDPKTGRVARSLAARHCIAVAPTS